MLQPPMPPTCSPPSVEVLAPVAGGGAARSGPPPPPRGPPPPPLLLGAAVVGGLLSHGDDAMSRREERRAGAKLGAAELRPQEPRPSSTCRAGGAAASEEGGARAVPAPARHGHAAAPVEASCAGGRGGVGTGGLPWRLGEGRGDPAGHRCRRGGAADRRGPTRSESVAWKRPSRQPTARVGRLPPPRVARRVSSALSSSSPEWIGVRVLERNKVLPIPNSS